jgi:hypothetical protein
MLSSHAGSGHLGGTPATRPTLLHRVGPGVLGFIAIGGLSHALDSGLRAAGVFPALGVPMGQRLFALATVYRSLIGVLGCYFAARLSSARPMRSALALAYVGLGLSALGIMASLHKPELGPLWYPVALTILTLPSAWLGGKLATSAER